MPEFTSYQTGMISG
jgi:hypothetical protein